MGKKFETLQDIVIPKGTVLECCDNETMSFRSGNYLKVVGLTFDTSGYFIYGIDEKDEKIKEWFKEVS
jgi:hypothetical protein